MSILFAGGEDSQFRRVGKVSVDTASTTKRRTSYSRCCLKHGPAQNWSYDGWLADLYSSSSDFWLTGRFIQDGNAAGGTMTGVFLSVRKGAVPKIVVDTDGGSSTTAKWRFRKLANDGTSTTLATSTGTFPGTSTTMRKYDLHVVYGSSGSIDLYEDGVSVLSYTGDVTTNSDTSVDGFHLGACANGSASGSASYWSEIIAHTQDTRNMSLATIPPSGAGASSDWTGAYTDVSETSIDTNELSTSSVNQLSEFAVTPATIITGSLSIRELVVTALARRGDSGPQNLQLVVRSSGDNFSSTQSLQTYHATAAYSWETSPTGGSWTPTDLNSAGFQIGVKSIT